MNKNGGFCFYMFFLELALKTPTTCRSEGSIRHTAGTPFDTGTSVFTGGREAKWMDVDVTADFCWTLGKPGGDIFTRWFGGFFLQDSGYHQGYEIISRESKPKPVFVTDCYWVGVACNIIYMYISIRVINIYIYTHILRKPSLPRFCCVIVCRVWTWRTMVQNFFHVKVLLAISVMISVWGAWSIWKDDRSEQEMLIDFFWAALIFRWYIHSH